MAHNDLEVNQELSELVTELWGMDSNACIAGQSYELDLQGYVTTTREIKDYAKHPLFAWVDEESVFTRPTYKTFRALLDNYRSETGKSEEVTPEEIKENEAFIDAIMETAVMQKAHEFLVSKKKADDDVQSFKDYLYKKWFKLYRRSREYSEKDSSGFEHVFVGESRDGEAIGFHNWIQFYLEEKKGAVDYKGYFRRGTPKEAQPNIITIQFTWKKVDKPIGSSFIGTSPEFEIALYTIINALDLEAVKLNIAEYEVDVFVHRLAYGIGSAYPICK